MAILGQILTYCIKNNMHLLTVLFLIAWIAWKVLVIYKEIEKKYDLSAQSNDYRFGFIGDKLTGIDAKMDNIVDTVSEHSEKIVALESVQTKWDTMLKTKFEKEEGINCDRKKNL